MLEDGIYGLTIQRRRRQRQTMLAEALVVVRGGTILGSGPLGGTFSGTYAVDAETGANMVSVHFEVPPGSELLTGFKSGPDGASFRIEAAFDRACDCYRTEIAGKHLEIAAAFLGPLPG